MNESSISIKDLSDREKRQMRVHTVSLVLYALLIIAFIVWGVRPKRWDSTSGALFCIFLMLPVCGCAWEWRILSRNLANIRGLKTWEREQFLPSEKAAVLFPDAEEATGFFLPPEIRVLAIRILIGALCCFTITAVKSFRKEQKSEPSIPVLPADAEDFKYDTFESHRADPDPDTPYVDIPEHGSTKTWMNNLTILPQVLYEDDRFKVEITGCKAKRDALEISTRVINDSTFRISAHAVRDSVYINQLKSSENLSFGYRTEPGESEERIISLRGRDIPWYDAYLDEIRLCLEICNEDEEDYRSPGYTLVTTEPIIIRTETVDPEIPKPSLIQPDQGMKVLYEEDGVRIVRTGLFEAVFLKDGKAGMLSSTFWQIVVENDTPDEIVIDNVDCETNGRGNLGEIHSTTVPSGFREEIEFDLYGAMPDDETLSDPDGISSVAELYGAMRWPLEEIEASSMSFDVHYTDSSGAERHITLNDEWHKQAEGGNDGQP